MWPLATPPMAGLHDIFAMSSRCTVSSAVARPMRAQACAASQPACPAPTTTTSKRVPCAPPAGCRRATLTVHHLPMQKRAKMRSSSSSLTRRRSVPPARPAPRAARAPRSRRARPPRRTRPRASSAARARASVIHLARARDHVAGLEARRRATSASATSAVRRPRRRDARHSHARRARPSTARTAPRAARAISRRSHLLSATTTRRPGSARRPAIARPATRRGAVHHPDHHRGCRRARRARGRCRGSRPRRRTRAGPRCPTA